MDVFAIILIIIGSLIGLFAIVCIANCLSNSSDTSYTPPPQPKRKPTQAERDAYYIQQFGMTEADYMATVDMYANWDD